MEDSAITFLISRRVDAHNNNTQACVAKSPDPQWFGAFTVYLNNFNFGGWSAIRLNVGGWRIIKMSQ